MRLEDQDRGRWDAARIAEGSALVERALRMGRVGPYQLQAAIAAVHDEAATADATDWPQILGLYEVLAAGLAVTGRGAEPGGGPRAGPGPGGGPGGGRCAGGGSRDGRVPLLPRARADFLRRLGRWGEAADAYDRALALAPNGPERAFLERRRRETAMRGSAG